MKTPEPIFFDDLTLFPLTGERWADLETLFGVNGAYAGCWCMWWRLSRAEFSRLDRESRRLALKALVDQGVVPGVLAYVDGQPAAWCSLAPREQYLSLERSPTLKRIDDQPVWSIVCFYVARAYRRRAILLPLIRKALQYAAQNGARIVEAYPYQPDADEKVQPVSSFMGLYSTLYKAGFVEVSRPSPKRPLMRYIIEEPHD